MTAKTVLVVCADGSEDIELVCITDVLRRAKADVTLATINASNETTFARGLKIVADVVIDDVKGKAFDCIAIPGGMPGAKNLAANETFVAMLKEHAKQKRLYAAICASPAVVLHAHGLLSGKKATCYPSLADKMTGRVDERVVVDGNVITSQGPGSSIEFALAIVEHLYDANLAKTLSEQMVVKA